MKDEHTEAFTHRLAPRDSDFCSEWIGIWLDTFNDDNNAYFFFVNIDNVKQDGRLCEVGGWDSNWDGLWESATAETDSGWTAEIAIPFSVLRYSDDPQQVWGVNFKRTITRTNESAYLFPMADNGSVMIEDFGDLSGLRELPSQRNLSVTPYGAGRIRFLPDEDADPWSNAGIDARIGLSSELLLDLTANPDFGQVEADPRQANLSHWETYLREKRPFFLEGADMFSMPFSLFYSRRIGAVAGNGEIVPVLAGAKVTGSAEGLRIGFLNAVTGEISQDGTVYARTTNYAAGRVVREFGEGTYVGLSATSSDDEEEYARSGAVDIKVSFLDQHSIYAAAGGTWNSREENWRDNLAYRASYYYDNGRTDLGLGVSMKQESFDANTIGYTSSTGDLNGWLNIGRYHPFSGSRVLDHWWGSIYADYSRVPGGPVTERDISLNTGVVFSNRYHIGIDAGYDGSRTDRYEGPEGTIYDGGMNWSFDCSSDSRKPVYAYLWAGTGNYCEGVSNYAGTSITFKPVSHVSVSSEINWDTTANARKYNWSREAWDIRDTDWRSLQLSMNWMFSTDLSLRLTSQLSRFSSKWDSGEDSRELSHWMNALLSWEFRPGSMFYFMAGENADPGEDTGDPAEAEFTLFTKLTWNLLI